MPEIDVPEIEVLLLAAGRGERLEAGPKAFLQLRGETLLERMVGVGCDSGGSVIAAVQPEDVERAERLVGERARVIAGGNSRAQTFRLLLAAARAPTIVVLDVAHPLVTADLCRRVVARAEANGSAAAAVLRTHDEVIRGDGEPARYDEPLYLLSKPICFSLESIKRGLAAPAASDETGVLGLLHLAGESVELVESEPWNVKLTTSDDWSLIRLLADRLAEKEGPS